MAQQSINLGTTANDGTGDTLRVAGLKVNSNFTEVYSNVSLLQIYTTSAFAYANTAYNIAQFSYNKANNSDFIVAANVANLRSEITANATASLTIANLKSVVAISSDFADFKIKVAAL